MIWKMNSDMDKLENSIMLLNALVFKSWQQHLCTLKNDSPTQLQNLIYSGCRACGLIPLHGTPKTHLPHIGDGTKENAS